MCTTTRSVRSSVFKTTWAHHGKRFTHRAPDVIYLTKGAPLSSYYSKRSKEGMAYLSSHHPELFSAYLKTAATMVAKGKVPLVHGQRASWTVAFRFTQYLNAKASSFFKFLRPYSQEYLIKREDLAEKIKGFLAKHGDVSATPGTWGSTPSRLDHDESVRPHLLSTNYALMGNLAPFESAFHFTFQNGGLLDEEKEWSISKKVMQTALKAKGISEEKMFPLLKELKFCFDDYASLKTGNLLLIGVPKEKISSFAYDAKAYGIPTGTPIEKVVSNPAAYAERFDGENGGFQARFCVFKETLDPRSMIDVILVNDSEEVEAYAHQTKLTPPEAVDAFKPFVFHKSPKEEEEYKKRKAIDEKIKSLALEVKRGVSN
jgi:hypothetical protein